jgi:GcrA cell cycle regulator
MIWTEEAIDRVRHLAEVEGLSGAGISSYFNNCSRSAIISLCHRKGISLKRTRANQHNGVRRIKHKPSREYIMIAESYVPPVEQRMSLMELNGSSCRWPLGDGPDYFFCGGISLDRKSWGSI